MEDLVCKIKKELGLKKIKIKFRLSDQLTVLQFQN